LERVLYKEDGIARLKKTLDDFSVTPDDVETLLVSRGTPGLKQQVKLPTLISRPQLNLSDFKNVPRVTSVLQDVDDDVLEQLNIGYKYAGYIDKEKENASKMHRLEDVKIPTNFDFMGMKSMSMEGREKLTSIRPATIRQASHISGISPSDIQVLLVHLGR
jgi:tRNA uridine 5-carboxymethylaminomethyl modification enzyme